MAIADYENPPERRKLKTRQPSVEASKLVSYDEGSAEETRRTQQRFLTEHPA